MHLTTVIHGAVLAGVAIAADPFNVASVRSVMISRAKSSWEFGTVSQTILELDNPANSVFGNNSLAVVSDTITSLVYAKEKITLGSTTLCYDDLSHTDPASLGVAATMLGRTDSQYTTAATSELNTLMNNNPKTSTGAISARYGSVQIWTDALYMFPPFFAYYAAVNNDETLLDQTVTQLSLYRAGLQKTNGAWAHILGGNSDTGEWSTGNGWAAYGMARVLATIQNGAWASTVKTEYVAEITDWIQEIIDGAMSSGRASNGLLRNYLDNSSTFGETSGTSFLAATVYRMAVLAPATFNSTYVAWAEASLKAVAGSVGSTGIIAPAVNPYSYRSNTAYTLGSPEGQAFALCMYAARRDCIESQICTGT